MDRSAPFFHDHDWELELLRDLLKLQLCYIDAQGSKNTWLQREQALEYLRVDQTIFAQVHGPIVLITVAPGIQARIHFSFNPSHCD